MFHNKTCNSFRKNKTGGESATRLYNEVLVVSTNFDLQSNEAQKPIIHLDIFYSHYMDKKSILM